MVASAATSLVRELALACGWHIVKKWDQIVTEEVPQSPQGEGTPQEESDLLADLSSVQDNLALAIHSNEGHLRDFKEQKEVFKT